MSMTNEHETDGHWLFASPRPKQRVIPLYAEPELTLAFVFQKTLIRDLI